MSADNPLSIEAAWREGLRQNELPLLLEPELDEEPDAGLIMYWLDLGQDPELCLARILEVITILVNTSELEWPTDEEWQAKFPVWFLQSMHYLSRGEYEKFLRETPEDKWDLLPWHFGSWVAVMRVRGWRWEGYQRVASNELFIYLDISDWPAHLEAFEWILECAGVECFVHSHT
jgi:hypothetical protein